MSKAVALHRWGSVLQMLPHLVKVFIYFLFWVVLLGFLQLWIEILIKHQRGEVLSVLSWEELLSDGSLFFYATSIYAGAAFTLAVKENSIPKSLHSGVYFGFMAILLLTALYYGNATVDSLSELAQKHASLEIKQMSRLHEYLEVQALCVLIAVLVALGITISDTVVDFFSDSERVSINASKETGQRPEESAARTQRE